MIENASSTQSDGLQSTASFRNATLDAVRRQFDTFAPRTGLESTDYDLALRAIVALAACTILWKITHLKHGQKTDKSQEKTKSRRAMPGAIPPVFPNGWIPVLESSELVVGKIKSISVLEHTAKRIISCVISSELRSAAPSFVKAKAWPCKELLGLVFVWYHADGEEPTWDVPEDILGETLESEATGRFEHLVHCHIQDIAENGADLGHFNQIHKASSFVGGDEFQKTLGESWKGRLFQHHWTATWNPKKHEAAVIIESSISILGWKPNYLRHHIEARQ
ncbi:hypothetical protein V5799_030203, partial [Amblyomma americanum]